MSNYSVKTEVFEGPFDLLLDLVSRQKLDINAISLTEITDNYIEHIEQMKENELVKFRGEKTSIPACSS